MKGRNFQDTHRSGQSTEWRVEFEFDRAFFLKGTRFYLWPRLFWYGVVMLIAFLILAAPALREHGHLHLSTILIPLGGMIAIAWKFILVWRNGASDSLKLLSKLAPNHRMVLRVDQGGVTTELGESITRFEWSAVRRLRRSQDIWYLEITRVRGILFPAKVAPEGMGEFIVECCRAVGARV